MKKLLISAGAVAALALTSAPAAATPVSATANAKAKIYTPLTIAQVNGKDLDFATIVLSGTGAYTNTITVDQAGVITCGANVTCSGTTSNAAFTVTGTKNANVTISLPSPTVQIQGVNNSANKLTVTLIAPPSTTPLNLGSTGTTTFGVGGSLQVSNTTPDDLYSAQFTVNADYQ